MKSLKITTYCTWTSLGSVLQTLGLKKALSVEGYDSTILLKKGTNDFTYTKVNSVKSLLFRLFEILYNNKIKTAYKKRSEFIVDNIDIQYFTNYTELKEISAKDSTEIYLAGSDQIWHPDHCDPVFFLDFANGKRRVSYAASMGKTEVSATKKQEFGRLIGNFDHISVREQECAKVISGYSDKEISVNIDPTFLVSADEWRRYEVEYRKIKTPYILLYMLYWNDSCKEKIKEIKHKTGLPVYAISGGLSKVYADKFLYDVGPGEFLWLIDNAEYVITSSFHGVAFSTIFNKKFAAVNNPKLPSRIDNLCRILSVPIIDIASLTETGEFDYYTINTRIIEEKEKSLQYLKRILG